MPSLPVLKTLARELVSRERSPRRTEPDLVMDDPEKVAAYTRAGREDGVMAPVYLFHCAQVCEVIRPGDTVVDLGCGPATQLAMVARLNPDVRFVGVDLSEEMLERARAYGAEQGLGNVAGAFFQSAPTGGSLSRTAVSARCVMPFAAHPAVPNSSFSDSSGTPKIMIPPTPEACASLATAPIS